MPRKTASTLEKILNSETRFKELVKKRNQELLAIITKLNAIAIDDNLLAGFLIFATNQDNKDHPMLKEFMGLAKSTRNPSKSSKQNNNPA